MVNIGAIIVVLFSSILKGLTGFGFALVALPVLMIWYNPKELIPVMVLCNLLASLFIILEKKEKLIIDDKLKQLVLFGATFTIIGVCLLKFISDELLIHIVSVLFIVIGLLSMFKANRNVILPTWCYRAVGAFIGFLTGSISISGPPMAIFLNWTNVNNQVFREVFAWFSVATSIIAIVSYWFAGLLSSNSLKMALIFSPFLLLGTIIGKSFNKYMPNNVFKNVSLVITLIASVMLLIK